MDAQEYLEFVTMLEDTRTRVETVLSDPSFKVSGSLAARLKRVAADLERAAQTYRDKQCLTLLKARGDPQDDWLANRVADGHPEVGLSSSSVRGR
jgi:hypothetical protein